MREMTYKEYKNRYKKRRERYELILGTLTCAILSLVLGSVVASFFYVVFYPFTENSIIYFCIWCFASSFFIGTFWIEDYE